MCEMSSWPYTVYSDLYFRQKEPLRGVLKNLRDFTQLENNTLVCGYRDGDCLKAQNATKVAHLSLYEVKKTIEFMGVLRNMAPQYDFDMNIAAFRAKCFENLERNCKSFEGYRPIIVVNETEAYEQYFETKRLEDVWGRCPLGWAPTPRRLGRLWVSNNDLDRITPVLSKRDHLSSLSVHELEEILMARARARSADDLRLPTRHFPLLEPLLLKDEDATSEKVRLRIAEHKKLARITIAYTLAFFLLAIITFYIIYYA